MVLWTWQQIAGTQDYSEYSFLDSPPPVIHLNQKKRGRERQRQIGSCFSFNVCVSVCMFVCVHACICVPVDICHGACAEDRGLSTKCKNQFSPSTVWVLRPKVNLAVLMTNTFICWAFLLVHGFFTLHSTTNIEVQLAMRFQIWLACYIPREVLKEL